MSLKTFISNIRNMGRDQVVTRTDFSPASVPGWAYESFGMVPGAAGDPSVAGSNRPAENVLMIYGCLTARRESMAKVPLRVSMADDSLLESGPLVDLLAKPNRMMNWGQYVRILETHSSLYNMIAVARVGEPGQVPDELIPLSPAYLIPEYGVHQPTGTAMVMRYNYSDPMTGAQRQYLPEQLLINMGYNPHAPLQPLSPLSVLRKTINAELSARQQNLSLFANNAMPAAVLENSNTMTKEQATEVLDDVEARLKGVANRGKLLATWGGLKFNVLGLSPAEMEYLNGLKFLRTDYYIVFRVPPAMLYEMMPVEMGKGNESTESQKVEWWEDVGLAELDMIADLHQPIADDYASAGLLGNKRPKISRADRRAISRAESRRVLRSSSGAVYLWFDDNAIPALVRHRLARLDQQTKIAALGYLPDDINDYLDLGLPSHPDNIGRVPFALQPIGEGVGPDSDQDLPGSPDSAKVEEGPDRSQDPLKTVDRIESLLIARADSNRKRVDSMRERFQKFIAPREKQAARKYSRYFLEQKGRVLDRLQKAMPIARAEFDSASGLIETIFPKPGENTALFARLAPLWSEHLKDGWQFLNTEVGMQETKNPFAIDDPRVMAALREREIQAAKINDTTEDALRGIIGESLTAGESTAEMGDRIAAYYAENCVGETSARPMTSARTQTAGIVNQGRQMAALEVGGLEKFWIHGNPNEPREAHLAASEQYQANPIPLEEPFVVNGVEMMYPGDPSAPPAEVCNCTCTVGYRIKKAA
jgi:HK97 family phage portal protein